MCTAQLLKIINPLQNPPSTSFSINPNQSHDHSNNENSSQATNVQVHDQLQRSNKKIKRKINHVIFDNNNLQNEERMADACLNIGTDHPANIENTKHTFPALPISKGNLKCFLCNHPNKGIYPLKIW